MLHQLRKYIARFQMIAPGDRIAAAVSGGADSVCLFRLLLALKAEIGFVLSVAHFDHQLRPDSAADARFVEQLAREHACDFHSGSEDVRAHAVASHTSLESAARELRHRFFDGLLRSGKLNKIATAHTQNDQAETVLMKLIRGAGPRGLSAIHPVHQRVQGALIRPLLFASRAEIEGYLRALPQEWREDATNAELVHTRNRVRHQLMPVVREFNPDASSALSQTAEILRADEEYLQQEVERALPFVVLPGEPIRGGGRSSGTHAAACLALSLEALAHYPLALQRRLVREALRDLCALSLADTDRILELATAKQMNKWIELAGALRVRRLHRELQIQPAESTASTEDYEVHATFDGTPLTTSAGAITLRVSLVAGNATRSAAAISKAKTLDLPLALTLRNWRPGDRFEAPHSRAPKKVKEYLQSLKLTPEQRAQWPVLEASQTGEILWLRGFPTKRISINGAALSVEESTDA